MSKNLLISVLLLSISIGTWARPSNPTLTLRDCFQLYHGPSRLTEEIFELADKLPPARRHVWFKERGPQEVRKLDSLAGELEKTYQAAAGPVVKNFIDRYGDVGSISGRAKSKNSILAKLVKKDVKNFEKGNVGISSLDEAKAAIGDGIGMRMILNADPSGKIAPETVQTFVNKLCDDIEGGRLEVKEVLNYRAAGEQGSPYLSDSQISQISQANDRYRKKSTSVIRPIIIKNGDPETLFASGYSSFHMNVSYPNGVTGEIQVRGAQLQEVSEVEHFFYDIKQGKILGPEKKSNAAVSAAYENYLKLTSSQKNQLENYYRALYNYARAKETGIPIIRPDLPSGLPSSLDFDSLRPFFIKLDDALGIKDAKIHYLPEVIEVTP